MEQTGSFLSRRRLIAAGGAAAIATVAVLAKPFRAFVARNARKVLLAQPTLRRILLSLADANFEEWQEVVGTVFLVGGGSALKLIDVTAFPSLGIRPLELGRMVAFMAKFDVQGGGTMAGDLIYTASHPAYGTFPIFLSASSDPSTPYRMTAVFN